jgi:hypothetical protein
VNDSNITWLPSTSPWRDDEWRDEPDFVRTVPLIRKPFRRVRAGKGPVSLIFCDFDGVLNDHASGAYGLLDDQVARLDRLARATGSLVVVSSWWRWIGVGALRRDLQDAGFAGQVIGRTPWLGETREWDAWVRGTEIQAVLDYLGPRVTGMVILDDRDRMGDLLPWLVQTESSVGITDADVDAAMAILAKDAPTASAPLVTRLVDNLSAKHYPKGSRRTGRAKGTRA